MRIAKRNIMEALRVIKEEGIIIYDPKTEDKLLFQADLLQVMINLQKRESKNG